MYLYQKMTGTMYLYQKMTGNFSVQIHRTFPGLVGLSDGHFSVQSTWDFSGPGTKYIGLFRASSDYPMTVDCAIPSDFCAILLHPPRAADRGV